MFGVDPYLLAVAAPAVVFAAVAKAGFGSGAAFASSAFLALVLPPGTALALMLPLLMLMDIATLGPYWGRWSGRDAGLLILSALPGVALGAWLYTIVDPDVFRLLIGIVAVVFVLWRLVPSRTSSAADPRQSGAGPSGDPSGDAGSGDRAGQTDGFTPARIAGGAVAGSIAGFTSFVSHAGGPPVAMYLLAQNFDKTRFQATTVLVFWAINISKLVPFAALGLFTAPLLKADLLLAPFALFGVWLGVRAHRAVSQKAFFALAYIFLALTGAKLIWDALT
ncbi:sulfite exporter TauE/SafE family protein [Chachezhania sediminis]|uniref:sulfite exporter TauE/SafE family protein n=1 Tax=Chachezhania sediminis TaxID=2599291 RepID=UPI00131C67CD|nr:sulfite exporter TauE/SafE family protein [Chachezhania sediminis]